jgi:cytochrome P450
VLGGGSIRVLETLSAIDPPDHTKFRELMMPWFMPESVRTFQDQIKRDAKEAVDRLRDLGGECEFTRDFAMLYPLRVIMTLLGVPREDEPLMLKLTQDFFGTREPDAKPAAPAADPAAIAKQWHAGITGFFEYFDKLADERRMRPTSDFGSLLANAQIDGKPIDRSHLNAFCLSMAAAGHDTTASSVSGGMLGLLTHPDQLAAVQADLSLVPGLVDESLRWSSPVKHFMRSARKDTELKGQQIKEGDRLMLLYASANRDVAVFDDPYTFRVNRKPNRHLSMGTGHHACVGQHVAKLEMRTLWEELLPRLRAAELLEEPTFIATNWVGGLKKLQVRYDVA